MSQHLQFRDGTSDTYNFPVQDSPTIGRTLPQSSSATSQGGPSPLSETGHRYVVSSVEEAPPSNTNQAFEQDALQGDPEPITVEHVRESESYDYYAYEV